MNRLPIALLVAAAALAALWMSHDDGTIVDRTPTGTAFLEELADHVNEAASLSLTKGTESIELTHAGSDWVLAGDAPYPAKFDAVRELLVSLARLQDAEPRTSQPDRFGELLLDEEGPSAGTRVVVEDAAGKTLADVIVGKQRWRPSPGTYLRLTGKDQAYLCPAAVRVQTTKTAWIDPNLIKLAATELARMTISGDVEVEVERDESGALVLSSPLPEGRVLKSPSPFTALFGTLARLDLSDVDTAARFEAPAERRLTFTTTDGGSVELSLWHEGPAVWAKLAASASAPAELSGPPAPTAEGQAPPEPAPQISEQQAADWNAAWAPFAFELPSYRATSLFAGWDDWLAPLPEPVEQTEQAPASPEPQPEPGS